MLLKLLKKPGWRGTLLGLLCAVVASLVSYTSLRNLDEWFQDGCFSFRGKRPTHARVILIGLDDLSLDKLHKPTMYTSPELARVVAFLKEKKAAAVGLDLIVPESLAGLPDLQAGKVGDATQLGQAIQDAGNVVLARWKLEGRWLQPLPQWQLRAFLDPDPTDLGFVNLTEDDDFFLRRQQLYIKDADEGHMHFALALYARAQHAKVEWSNDALLVGGEWVPLDEEQTLRINFVGPPETFPVISLGDALAAARGEKPLAVDPYGAIVIIGTTARSQQDYHATPYANNYWRTLHPGSFGLMAGSEVHAHIIATLADRAYISTPPWPVTLGILLGFGGVLGRVFARLSLAWGFVLAFAHHWVWKLVACLAFSWFNLQLEVVSMLLLGVLAYGVAFLSRWWLLRQMLGVVKSEAIARLLENDPGQLDLRGEECIATVLFADIRNFTSYSENHGARQVVTMLNAYFSAIVPLIEKHGGALNQYMGDGIMVLFGVPLRVEDHARRAVLTAVAMVRQVHELKDQWKDLDFKDLRIGVGVHTGRVIAGTVGSARRLDYTVIGDTVNTAARIEAQNKDFGTEILISADTYRDLPGNERQALGCSAESRPAEVKGKKQTLYLHPVAPQPAGVPAQTG